MKNKAILGALSLDLKRVALGYFRGSIPMADRFFTEALKRREELDEDEIKPYLLRFLDKIDSLKKEKAQKAAEDALLYSTIFQNASRS
jgi:hypothetical protein